MTPGGAYDLFAYPGYAYPATHPARLEAIARLFGLRPTAAAQSKVLELGCGDGGNLLSLAAALPEAQLVGIDAAPSAVERGMKLARAAGLENVQLRCIDLQALPEGNELEGEGGFDYILSHGVYSWIPARVRVALLAGIRRHLAPMGIAYVSYNAYPGSYLRDMARDVLDYHVRDIADPQEKLAAAQELMQTIVAIEEPSPYARVLREHMERMLRYSSALLFHDDLAEISSPFYLHEFIEHATHHHLGFLAEADLFESQMRDVPESAERLMADLPDDVVVREQYLDFFKNRMFRQTLLCHEHAPVSRELDDTQIETLAICSPAKATEADDDAPLPADGQDRTVFTTPEGYSMTTSEQLVQGAMRALGDAWPRALSFAQLLEQAQEAAGEGAPEELVRARLRVVLLQAYLARIIVLQGCGAPVASVAEERPRASALARAQSAAGAQTVSSLLHANVRLEGELEERVLPLLDGTGDRAGLLRELALEDSGEALEATLERFAEVGLLVSWAAATG